jgi:hypothetical protein
MDKWIDELAASANGFSTNNPTIHSSINPARRVNPWFD